MPASLLTHTCFGPPDGHSCIKPFSLETWLRSGPPHWGQSSAGTEVTKKANATPTSLIIGSLPGIFIMLCLSQTRQPCPAFHACSNSTKKLHPRHELLSPFRGSLFRFFLFHHARRRWTK